MNALLTLGLPILPHLSKITRFTQINSLSCWKIKSASLLVFNILSFIGKDSINPTRPVSSLTSEKKWDGTIGKPV